MPTWPTPWESMAGCNPMRAACQWKAWAKIRMRGEATQDSARGVKDRM